MQDMNLNETVLEKSSVFDGIIIHVEHWQAKLPNGDIRPREIAVHIGASAVVPVDDEGNVYLVRQYRCPAEKILLEIPAGKLDHKGEDKLEAAKRELSEETGFTASRWTMLTDLWTTPGFCSERIGIYLAQGLTAGETHPDEDEFLGIVKMPLTEAKAMVMRGELCDSKSITGILMACELLGR